MLIKIYFGNECYLLSSFEHRILRKDKIVIARTRAAIKVLHPVNFIDNK